LAWAQKNKIFAVFNHVIQNSLDAVDSDASDSQGRIELQTVVEDPDFVTVRIRDNGIGIPDKHLSKIFEMGYTTKAGAKGFGLHFCVLAMREMNGNIDVIPCQEGVLFKIRVPLAPKDL